MKDDALYLQHILDCIEHIQAFTAGGRDEFFRDRKTQDAVLRNLQVLAESGTRLSQVLRDQRPEVDWRGISGFRNVLVHDYLGLNLKRVWSIVQNDLPVLRRAVEELLSP